MILKKGSCLDYDLSHSFLKALKFTLAHIVEVEDELEALEVLRVETSGKKQELIIWMRACSI